MGSPHSQQKSLKMQDVDAISKMTEWSVCFEGKPLNITVIQVYIPTSNAEEAEVERFYEDLQYLLELTPKKRCPFHHRGLECKSRKSRDSYSNRQVWPQSTKRSRAKANRILPREHTGHSKHPLSSNKTREDSTHGHHQMVNTEIRLIILFAAKNGEVIYSQQKQDWEWTVAQIMNSILWNSELNWRK